MKSLLYWSVCVTAIAAAAPAHAQQATQEADHGKRLGSIMVTGELIDRSLRESGSSTDVLDDADLRRRAGLTTVRDILDVVTNISVVSGTGKAPTVRGIDGTGPAENANAFFAGSRPRLSWRIDGRPASYNEIVFGDLAIFDLDRIEVLRGAQSTLVGRNAVAGTVIINTKEPHFDYEATALIGAGNFDQRRTAAMVNVPIVDDQVAFRLSADWYKRQSGTTYTPYEGVENPGKMEAVSVRGKLLVTPDFAPQSELLLTLSHTKYTGPNSEIIVRPFKDRRSNFPNQPVHQPKTTSAGAQFESTLSDSARFTLNASTTQFDMKRAAMPGSSNATIDTRELVLEPQLHYKSKNGYSGVAGLFLYRARQDEFIEFLGGQTFDDDTDTVAVYGEALLPLARTVDLSMGLRYEREKHQRHGGDATGTLVKIATDTTHDVFLPKLGLNWKPSDTTSWGAQISRGYNAGGGGITFVFPIVNYEYDAEYVWSYELYGRQEIADGKVRLTQNIFYSRYKNMQLPFDLTPNESRDEAFIVRNAERVDTWGLELGAAATLTKHLDGYLNLGLLQTDIAKYPGSGVEGNQLLTAPKITANAGIAWSAGPWSAALGARYSGGYYSDVNNRAGGKTKAYVVADAKIAYDFKRVRIFATVKNLNDTDAAVARYPGVAPAGSAQQDSDLDSAVLLQPRTLFIGLEARL